jgi:hypothetical protein
MLKVQALKGISGVSKWLIERQKSKSCLWQRIIALKLR